MFSALSSNSDIARCIRHVSKVPISEVRPTSFDHLVSQQLERVRHGETKGGGRLEINNQFVFERELNGQIAWICASQNLVNIGRGRSRLLQLIDTIRHQTTALGIEAKRID